MRNRRGIAAAVITSLIFAPSAFAGGNNVQYTRSNQPRSEEPGRHATLGLTCGLVAGLIVGGYAAFKLVEEDMYGDSSDAQFIGLWTVFAVGGAVGGYALGGGFSHSAEEALDLGRERVREAERTAALAAEPLPELRMSSVAGFGQLALVEPAESATVQVAALH